MCVCVCASLRARTPLVLLYTVDRFADIDTSLVCDVDELRLIAPGVVAEATVATGTTDHSGMELLYCTGTCIGHVVEAVKVKVLVLVLQNALTSY